jgi:hypothetical protein
LRSPLGSFAVARFLPSHPCTSNGRSGACVECGLWPTPSDAQSTDLNVLNFERLKWGGVRHTDVAYQVFDLEQFRKLAPRGPTQEDVALFRRILARIRTLAPKATASDFEKALAAIIPSSKAERRQLIEVLGLCGVLSYPGYRNHFDDTEPPKDGPYRDTDWGVPAMYWRAKDGYNLDCLQEYFPSHAAELASA